METNEKSKEKKVSLTEIILTVINGADFLTDEEKVLLNEAIDKKIASFSKPGKRVVIEKKVEEFIKSKTGVTDEEIAKNLYPLFPELTPFNFNSKLFLILQPASVKRFGIEKTKEGLYKTIPVKK
jgi:hypothetical protein